MAANGRCHFKTNTKDENYKTQFISQKHSLSYTFDQCDLCLTMQVICYDGILLILYFI